MANPAHIDLLRAGPAAINEHARRTNCERLDLTNADLANLRLIEPCFLGGADFSGAQLIDVAFEQVKAGKARFDNATIKGLVRGTFNNTSFRGAQLSIDASSGDFYSADFSGAKAAKCNFAWCKLRRATFDNSDLTSAIFQQAELPLTSFRGATVAGIDLQDTVLTGADLTDAKGLEAVSFRGRVIIDHETIIRSGGLPRAFLEGCGLPDEVIAFYEATAGAIRFYSAFISHSSADREFVQRLHSGLQATGIRCWLADKDLKIGDLIRESVDQAIRVYDKLLVVLSADSIQSAWVEGEVESALERERRESRTILFPIKVDDAVVTTDRSWASHIRRTRHIGDFRNWKSNVRYAEAFERLAHDMRKASGTST